VQDFELIETPENVELRRSLAGIGSRFIAGFLDSLIIILMYLILFLLFLFIADINVLGSLGLSKATARWAHVCVILVAFSIYWGYFVLFEMWTNGQSPGKKYMKIRVVRIEGDGISFSSIAIRNLLRAVDAIGFYAVAGIAMFATSKVQRLGDLAAGTVVISEELPDYSAHYDKKGRIVDDQATTSVALDASGLKPEEYRLLRNYWLRREQLSPEVREQRLPQLVRPILNRTGQSLPDSSPATLEKYVDELIAKARSTERENKRDTDGSEAGR
jgi:uncharacterized RDD family membrane protein YckC